jgi:hypothetical protein
VEDGSFATHGYPCCALSSDNTALKLLECFRTGLMAGNEGDVNLSNDMALKEEYMTLSFSE